MADNAQSMEPFHRAVIKLFVRLYDTFPHPQNMSSQTVTDLGFGEIPGPVVDGESMSLGTKANHVMEWLTEEGFIRFDPDPNYRPGTFWKVRLTLKGMTFLGYIPVSLQPQEAMEPLIQKARQALASKSHEADKRVIAELFKMAVGCHAK